MGNQICKHCQQQKQKQSHNQRNINKSQTNREDITNTNPIITKKSKRIYNINKEQKTQKQMQNNAQKTQKQIQTHKNQNNNQDQKYHITLNNQTKSHQQYQINIRTSVLSQWGNVQLPLDSHRPNDKSNQLQQEQINPQNIYKYTKSKLISKDIQKRQIQEELYEHEEKTSKQNENNHKIEQPKNETVNTGDKNPHNLRIDLNKITNESLEDNNLYDLKKISKLVSKR